MIIGLKLWLHDYLIIQLQHTLREKPHFSTMFSTTSQLSFIVENITFKYKMFLATQKWCQLISKIVDNVGLTLQQIENNVHMSICGLMLKWQHFSWKWHTF
jgi:hypothetical protein